MTENNFDDTINLWFLTYGEEKKICKILEMTHLNDGLRLARNALRSVHGVFMLISKSHCGKFHLSAFIVCNDFGTQNCIEAPLADVQNY